MSGGASLRGAFTAPLLLLLLLPVPLLTTGCAYVGEPLPPALNIPKPVTALSVEQVGPRLEVRFQLPEETTESLLLDIKQIELRVGAVDPGAWPGDAPALTVERGELQTASAMTPAAPLAGRRVVAGARVQSKQGKWSEWSPLAPIDVIEPLAAPASVETQAVPEGVRLRWRPPGATPDAAAAVMRIEKRAAANGRWEEAASAPVAASEWVDASAAFGEEQSYRLTVVAGRSARSEAVEPGPFTPIDKFAPAVPTGLAAAPGLGSIELSWDRPADRDLAGFRLYREPVAGPPGFTPVGAAGGSLLLAANASDRQIQPAAVYRYAVSSVDQRGNESARSAPVEVAAPN